MVGFPGKGDQEGRNVRVMSEQAITIESYRFEMPKTERGLRGVFTYRGRHRVCGRRGKLLGEGDTVQEGQRARFPASRFLTDKGVWTNLLFRR